MNCDCSVDVNCFDRPSFSVEEIVKAHKKHICCECREEILPGQQYQLVTGKWDGKFDRYRTCLPCHHIREHYCPHGYIFEGLREQIESCLGFDYTEPPDEDDED